MNPYREPGKPVSRLKQFFVDRTRMLWPMVVILAALSAIAATSSLRVNGILFGTKDVTVYAPAYGCKADWNGSTGTDDTTCLTNAIAALPTGSGGTLVLPPGNYLVTNTLQITGNFQRIVGAGVNQTTITFNPASGPKTLFYFYNNTSTGAIQNQIMGMRINSVTGNTVQKVAIDVVDQSTFTAQDIWIDPTTSSNTWAGNTSIGIRLRGREAIYIDRYRALADRPFEFDVCPNPPTTQSNDHVHISNTYLASTAGGGNSIMEIATGGVVTNLTIDGDSAWLVDKWGIHWVDTTSPAVHYNVNISGVRLEQAVDATGYGFYFDSTIGIQNVNLHDNYMASQNGVHLNGVTEARIASSVFPLNDATKKHLDISNTKSLILANDNFQINTLATMTGLTLMWAAPQIATGSPLPSTAYYADSTTAGSQPYYLAPLLTTKNTNVFINQSAANTTPIKFDTANAFSGGSEMFGIYNAGTREAYFDNAGDLYTVGSIIDTTGATQLQLGSQHAGSVALGRSGIGVFVSGSAIEPASAGGSSDGAAANYWSTAFSRHYSASGGAPSTPVAGTGCNTSSGPSVTGADSSGTVGIVCGGVGAVSSTILTMTFNTAWGTAPRCILSPANAATAAIPVAQLPFTSASTTVLTVTSNTTGLAAATYSWFYKCEQAQ